MMLNSVDLPQPDGPMMDTNSPGAMEKEISSTAVIAPSLVLKRLVTRSTSSGCVDCGCAATPVATDGPAGRSIAALGSALTLEELAFARPVYCRGGIWISSASCSLVSGAAVNLSATASCTIASSPTILSGSTAALGKKSSRVRLAIATGMP